MDERAKSCWLEPPTHDRFDRRIVLDWYDGVVQAVVECAACKLWFYAWLIAWKPGSTDRVYAFRRVSLDWANRLLDAFGEPPSTSASAAKFDPVRSERSNSLADEVFREPTEAIYVAVGCDVPDAVFFRRTTSRVLGKWARPAEIETVVDQEDEERERLRRLGAMGPSSALPT